MHRDKEYMREKGIVFFNILFVSIIDIIFVKIYVIHLLGTVVTILCN